jgi:predicted negative regulator of RcsB-dependent stress response
VDRLTRKQLKKDKFAQEVGHTVEFLGEHKRQFILYGGVALALVIIVAGLFYHGKRQHAVRQRALYSAMETMNAPVGPSPAAGIQSFATQDEKNQAVAKALTGLASAYPGSAEQSIAQYFLGTIAAGQGRIDEAVKLLSQAAGSSNEDYASLAKLTLAEVYGSQGKTSEAEKLLRPLIAKPTVLVPKVQASLTLARLLAPSKPDEARKLLEPLRTTPGAAGRAVITALGEMLAKR